MDKDRKWFPDEQGAGMIPFELREGFGGRHAFSQEIIDEIRKTEPEFGKIIGIDTARFSVSGPERNGVIIPARDPDSTAYKDMRHFLDAGGDEPSDHHSAKAGGALQRGALPAGLHTDYQDVRGEAAGRRRRRSPGRRRGPAERKKGYWRKATCLVVRKRKN